MTARIRLKAFIRGISLLMLFITFFNNYLFFSVPLLDALFRGLITYIVAALVLHFVVMIWRFAFSQAEWKLIIDGEPEGSSDETSEHRKTAVASHKMSKAH